MVGRDRELAFARAGDGTSRRGARLPPLHGPRRRRCREVQAGGGIRTGHAAGAEGPPGRCLPYGQQITFSPVREVIRQAAGIEVGDSAERARSRIASSLGEQDREGLIADRVVQMVGLSETTIPTEEIFWSFRKFVEGLAVDAPVFLVFEDIHWAEPSLLDLIEHVADWTRDAPILLVCLARTELLDQRRAWGGGKLNVNTIHLEPLSEDESGRLIANLMGIQASEEHSRSRIAEAAEGNTLFVEETLSMMIDTGLLTETAVTGSRKPTSRRCRSPRQSRRS